MIVKEGALSEHAAAGNKGIMNMDAKITAASFLIRANFDIQDAHLRLFPL
jgi:hypothetical protein